VVDVANITSVRRGHAADDVFDQLAAAILRGELEVGAPLPPERVLAERFGVSRIVVRQGVHRLAEMGLVRVRQGGASLVLDPHDASDLRVLALFYRFAPSASRHARDVSDMIEKQYLQGLSIVEVASRRASERDLRTIAEMVEAVAANPGELARFGDFEQRFWRALAAAGKNRVFRMEVAWWYETLAERPVPRAVAKAAPSTRITFYQELTRRLAEGEPATEYYLDVMRPILDAVLGTRAVSKGRKR
jgi:GntR family transcriptional regulator, transcriptional repressor for pyruvate dehydrogenase complex